MQMFCYLNISKQMNKFSISICSQLVSVPCQQVLVSSEPLSVSSEHFKLFTFGSKLLSWTKFSTRFGELPSTVFRRWSWICGRFSSLGWFFDWKKAVPSTKHGLLRNPSKKSPVWTLKYRYSHDHQHHIFLWIPNSQKNTMSDIMLTG